MSAAKVKQEKDKNEELQINEKLNELIQKNRKVLLIGLLSVIAAIVCLIIIFSVRGKILSDSYSKVDGFNRRYDKIKSSMAGEDENTLAVQEDIAALLLDLENFQKRNSGFAAARAYNISADIFWDQKNWAEAENSWVKAAKAAGKSYLAPVSMYNAAVAAEEQGNLDKAIELLQKTLEFGNDFPAAAKAQFSIGRLEEFRNNNEAAIESYRTLVNTWPSDPIWTNLAQSRIIVLSD